MVYTQWIFYEPFERFETRSNQTSNQGHLIITGIGLVAHELLMNWCSMAEWNTSSDAHELDDASDESDIQEEDEESLTEVASSSEGPNGTEQYTS